jgi:hypothetical protein
MVQIEDTKLWPILQGTKLTAPEFGKNVYYSSLSTLVRQSYWQIWLVDNRTEGQKIYPGDKVILFAQLPLERPLYDPYMRLMPDPDSPQYATVKAGEWAVWEIER